MLDYLKKVKKDLRPNEVDYISYTFNNSNFVSLNLLSSLI